MQLKEFAIMRYGPLPNIGRISLRNFNLFWGKNEDGKTLTIDALVKLLLGRNVKDFEHIDRVEEKPEGYVIIEDDKGKEFKLPEQGDLTKVTDPNLTPSECRNIFVIRNSDLSIARESDFYTNVTNRLTGLRTEDISKIKETLREIGKTTPSGVFRDIKDEILKTRMEDAKDLLEKFESLAREIKEKGFDGLEEESVRRREEIERIEQEIKNLEDARKRRDYENGKEALDKLTSALQAIKDLEIYNESDEQLWRDCEKKIGIYNGQKEDFLIDLRKSEVKLQEASGKLKELENEFRIFEARKEKLDDEVKPELKNYEMGLGKVKSEETRNRFYAVAAITSAALSAVSILAVILNPSPTFYGLLAFFLASTAIFAILRFSFTGKKAHLAAVFGRIRLTLSKFELDAENPGEVYSNIQKFEETYQRKSEDLQDVRKNKEKLEEHIGELQRRKIPDTEIKIEDDEKKIKGIEVRSKEESLEEYGQKLELKASHETQKGRQEEALKMLFGERSSKFEEKISHWKEEVEKLDEYKDKAKDIKYSAPAVSQLTSAKQECARELSEIEESMLPLQEKMRDVERKVNKEILREEYLYCKTSVDLEALRNKLQAFIDDNESRRENVLEVTDIFEEIEREEKERVSELFGEESPISKYFNQITNGLYEEVLFDQETGKIQVKRRDGEMLAAEKLSGGAYDQLYLSIRLALGERLLKGRKGFFILDDPFVKADPDRLQGQIETLKKISELGWQVIYFSAKGEIKDALKEDIKADTINYVEVQGIFS